MVEFFLPWFTTAFVVSIERSVSFLWEYGKGCIILLCHSMYFSYIYFINVRLVILVNDKKDLRSTEQCWSQSETSGVFFFYFRINLN